MISYQETDFQKRNRLKLIENLCQHKFNTNNLSFKDLNNSLNDEIKITKDVVKCAISEYFSKCALQEEGFYFYSKQDVPQTNLVIKEKNHNLKFYKNSTPIVEFDFVGTYKQELFIIEVKSGSFSAYNKLESVLNHAQAIFKSRASIILFGSFKSDEQIKKYEEYSKQYPFSFIDFGFSQKDYDSMINEYYSNTFNDEIRNIRTTINSKN
ncbi:MAG: hypothetical protein WC758_05365 [Candidatus Woesearchaeota archaeon]|jgi:hypothetical protein